MLIFNIIRYDICIMEGGIGGYSFVFICVFFDFWKMFEIIVVKFNYVI